MVKDKFRNIIIKVSYGLFAFIVSVTLWMFVEITENETQTRNIPVRDIVFKNQELLGSRGLLVSSVVTENLTITFEGPRSQISNLSGAVDVEVDLVNVRSTGTIALSYDEIIPDSVNSNAINILTRSTNQIILVIDRLMETEFIIETAYTGGTASEEYIADQPEIEPRTILIGGPEEIISQIAHIFVPIVADNLSSTYTDELEYILLGADGEELDSEFRDSGVLTFNHETVRVTIPIRQLKSITLQVELLHGVTTSASNTNWSAEPAQVIIAGDPELVRDLNSILLGTIDMSGFGTPTFRYEFPILLPNYVENISNITTAVVTGEVLGLTREFRSVSNLEVINVPDGYSAIIQTENLDVSIRGTAANLSLVRPENIWIVADLSELGVGSSWVDARATIVGLDVPVDITGDYRIVVRLTEENDTIP